MRRSLAGLAALFAAAAVGAAPAPAEPLPDCVTLTAAVRGTAGNCRATSNDPAALVFESRTRAEPPESDTPYLTTVTVLSGGEQRQVITERAYRDSSPQFLLRDLDGDGRDELLIITSTGGSGGDTLAVWRATGDSPTFTRAGELFGLKKFWRTADGFIAQYTHSGAGAGRVSLYRFVSDKLVNLAVLDVQTLDWPDDPPAHQWQVNGNTKCALNTDDQAAGGLAVRDQALRDAKIDPATAQQRFCSEPWASFYR